MVFDKKVVAGFVVGVLIGAALVSQLGGSLNRGDREAATSNELPSAVTGNGTQARLTNGAADGGASADTQESELSELVFAGNDYPLDTVPGVVRVTTARAGAVGPWLGDPEDAWRYLEHGQSVREVGQPLDVDGVYWRASISEAREIGGWIGEPGEFFVPHNDRQSIRAEIGRPMDVDNR